MRQTISPRLAMSKRRIMTASHAEHAEARRIGFLSAGQSQGQSEDAPRVLRIDDAIIPQPCRGVIRMTLALELLANRRLEFLLIGIAERLAAALQGLAFDGGENTRRLLAAHDRGPGIGPLEQEP